MSARHLFGIGFAAVCAILFLASLTTGKALVVKSPGWPFVAPRASRPIVYWLTVAGYAAGAAAGVWLTISN